MDDFKLLITPSWEYVLQIVGLLGIGMLLELV
jgi:hypothetical protein